MISYADIIKSRPVDSYPVYKVNLISNVALEPMLGDYIKWYGYELGLDISTVYNSPDAYLLQPSDNSANINVVLHIDNNLLNIPNKTGWDSLTGAVEKDAVPHIIIANGDIPLTSGYKIRLDDLVYRAGRDNFLDMRTWYAYGAPLSETACDMLAREICSYIRSFTGKARKCVVLDCDNVLWGGEAGELGPDGIILGGQYTGRAYADFQLELIRLYEKGILLCLCSKNSPDAVTAVLESHPDILLRPEHIAAQRINWDNKADNIRDISRQLNLSVDSMVFIDDSEYECGLVKKELPDVEVIRLEADKPHKYAGIIRDCRIFGGVFGCGAGFRTKMYRDEAKRSEARQSAADIEAYHKILDTRAEIKPAGGHILSRLGELSSRVNQFNLTARRYTAHELRQLADGGSDVIYIKAGDIYGDLGVVGMAVVRYSQSQAIIEAFMISCRAFYRDFDKALLRYIISRAANRGCDTVVGLINQTAKNKPFTGFYPDNGFSLDNGVYTYDTAVIPEYPSTIKVEE